jgi:hypothetical protein
MIDPSKDKFAYFKDNIQTAEDKVRLAVATAIAIAIPDLTCSRIRRSLTPASTTTTATSSRPPRV